MAFPRIRPYETYVLEEDGARVRLACHEIVLERPQGIDLEVNLAPHPSYRGFVSFSTFRGSLLLEPAAGDAFYIFVEPWPAGDSRRAKRRHRKRTPLKHVYAVDARGEKRAIPGRQFVVVLGDGAELEIDLAPPAPWAQHIYVLARGGALRLQSDAANVVGFAVVAGARGSSRRGKRD